MSEELVSFDDLLIEFEGKPEYQQVDRMIRPYFDLVFDILKRRNQLNLTQSELAELAGTHQSRISKIESGTHDIRLSTLIAIAEALRTEVVVRLVPLDTILEDDNNHFHELRNIRAEVSNTQTSSKGS